MSLLDTTIDPPQIHRLMMTQVSPPLAKRASVRWAAAGLVLAVGYADLARGGETLAPLLLVLGYCVLIPLAILS
jgi:hypothetical protein